MAHKDIQARSVGPELARVLPNDGIPWYRKRHLLRLNFSLLSFFLLSASDGYDGTLMNVFVLYPVVAWCNDRFGRKTNLGINFFCLALAVAFQTAATNPIMFVLGRLFVGASASFTSGSAPILMTEAAYPTHRGIITALFMCGWHVGEVLAAWVTFGTRNAPANWFWRIPSLLQCAVSILAFPGFIMTPQSPQWLASQEHVEEARVFLIKHHAGGDENSPLAGFKLQEIVSSLALETQYRRSFSWIDLFRGRGNRHRSFISVTLGVFAQWNGAGVVSYYLAPVLRSVEITSVTNQTMISGFLQLWNLILSVGAAFNVDRFGRRPLFLVSSIGMLCAYIIISGLSGPFAQTDIPSVGTAVISFLSIYYGFYDIAFTPLLVSYTCEVWPTRVALFFNTFVNPNILDAIACKYYIVYCVILVIITVAIWFWYPETNGYTLEEMAVVFDGNKGAGSKDMKSPVEDKTVKSDTSHVERV